VQWNWSENAMTLKFPFAAPITSGRAACRNAQEVVRRGGSEDACRNEADHSACIARFDRLKLAALPAFGVEDELDLVARARVRYGDIGLVPCAELTGDMLGYRLGRRGSRRRK